MSLVARPQTNPPPGAVGSTASLVIGLTLGLFGMMFAFVGVVLSGLCFIAGGIVCQGTSIGSIGHTMLGFGVPAVAVGILLYRRGRQSSRPMVEAQLVRQPETVALAPATNPPRASTDCARCGGPHAPSDRVCSWCGEYWS